MKEVSAVFQEGFSIGLPPDEALNTQAEYLEKCYNMVPGQFGLEPRKEVFAPDVSFEGQKWPWPALFMLSRYTLIFTETALFEADENWQLTLLLEHSWGTIPHVADFMDTVVFSCEGGQWIIVNHKVMPAELKGASFKTCCNYRGQLIIGNCSFPVSACSEAGLDINRVQGKDIVAWSKIGSIEWDINLGNEVGWAPMPWQGKVLAILPLIKEVVVYGDNGVIKLSAESEPVPTFGVNDFGDIGLFNESCVAGDFTKHLFLGTDYNLYKVEPERALSGEGKTPARLGYSHILKSLVNPIVTYDPAFGQWWIGDKDICFIYNGKGLSEANITPTHLNRIDGPLWGFYHSHGKENAVIETSPLSFNSRGIKTLMNIEADMESLAGKVYGQTSWKPSYLQDFRVGRKILFDPRGSLFPVMAGTEFKVQIEAPSYRDFKLSKIWLHFKNTDKTFSRGVINAGRPAE